MLLQNKGLLANYFHKKSNTGKTNAILVTITSVIQRQSQFLGTLLHVYMAPWKQPSALYEGEYIYWQIIIVADVVLTAEK